MTSPDPEKKLMGGFVCFFISKNIRKTSSLDPLVELLAFAVGKLWLKNTKVID